jgi:protein disulfide-isomerase A6
LAGKFFVATDEVRKSIVKEATALGSKAGETSKYYLRVMEKAVDGAEAYLEKESKRSG